MSCGMKAISQVLIPQRSLEATADICILSDPFVSMRTLSNLGATLKPCSTCQLIRPLQMIFFQN
jgi:hypothetical protein